MEICSRLFKDEILIRVGRLKLSGTSRRSEYAYTVLTVYGGIYRKSLEYKIKGFYIIILIYDQSLL